VNEEGVRTDALVQKIAQLVEQHLRLAPDVQPDALQTAMRNGRSITHGGCARVATAHFGRRQTGTARTFLRSGAPGSLDRDSGDRAWKNDSSIELSRRA